MRLLDIDLDAIVANCRGSTEGEQRVERQDVEHVKCMLGAASSPTRWFMDEHRHAYEVWRRSGVVDADVWHFDAHHDCYGATDHRVWLMAAGRGGEAPECVTSATYLLAAWRMRMVRHIYWVLPSWLPADFAAKALRREMGSAWRHLDIVTPEELPQGSWDLMTACWSRRWIEERHHEVVASSIPAEAVLAVQQGASFVKY